MSSGSPTSVRSPATRTEQVERAYAALNLRDYDGFCALYDPQVICVDQAHGNPVGHRALSGMHQSLIGAFPDLEYSVDTVLDCDGHSATQLSLRGTHSGALGRHAPTHLPVHLVACEISEWQDGVVVTTQLYWDQLAARQQLGLA
ncbi:MAG: hypothetical protein NVSMB29_10980 [Candidatus Dormibacteria bacterium]